MRRGCSITKQESVDGPFVIFVDRVRVKRVFLLKNKLQILFFFYVRIVKVKTQIKNK